MAFDDTTDLPTEQHQAPASVPRANSDALVPLGSGITINGETYTSALVQLTGGASDFPIFNPPFTDELRTYIVKAQFDGFGFVTRGDETHLVIKMKHYVFYDRDLGPLNDLQKANSPDELAELRRKAKEVAADDDTPDVDENQGSLFGEGPDSGEEGDPGGGAELPEGAEWGDTDTTVRGGEPTKAFEGPAFSSIEGGKGKDS